MILYVWTQPMKSTIIPGIKTKVSLEAFLSGTGFIEEFPTDLKIHVDQNFRGKKRSKEPGEKRRLGHK